MRIQLSLFLLYVAVSSKEQALAFLADSSSASSTRRQTTFPILASRAFVRPATTTARWAQPQDAKSTASEPSESPGMPSLNGKRVMPSKIILAGLKGQKMAGVYAIYNKDYKRGQEGWETCEFIGTTFDLVTAIEAHIKVNGPDAAAHARVMSFENAEKELMESVASDWGALTKEAVGPFAVRNVMESAIMYDEDDDVFDDDEDDEDDFIMTQPPPPPQSSAEDTVTSDEQETITSPFAEGTDDKSSASTTKELEFNEKNVDAVLDEVRPYLISDGGNVSVDRVDTATGNVYLILEGACGSCESSTVTMQMGIERVLRENFSNLGEVIRTVEEEELNDETANGIVEKEINRLKPAITAMGGAVELRKVDIEGDIEVFYRGPARVQQGLELALLDVDFVKSVAFVTDDE